MLPWTMRRARPGDRRWMASRALALPITAQPTDLSGNWHFSGKSGVKYRMQLRKEGTTWFRVANAKVLISVKLNPSGLVNEWVGDLEYFEKHGVKAQLKGADLLELTDLDDGEKWTLVRATKP